MKFNLLLGLLEITVIPSWLFRIVSAFMFTAHHNDKWCGWYTSVSTSKYEPLPTMINLIVGVICEVEAWSVHYHTKVSIGGENTQKA